MSRPGNAPPRTTRSLSYLALTITAAVSLAPLAWVWTASLRSPADITNHPLGLPGRLHWDNYLHAWTQARFADYLANSTLIAVGTVALVMACAVPASYALATLRLPLARPIFLVFLLGLMIPIWSIIIPLFFQMRNLGLVNT